MQRGSLRSAANLVAVNRETHISIVTAPFDRESWLRWRRAGIGGSDAAAICSLDPRRGPLAVYLDKVGLLPLDDRDETEEMRWGTLLQTAIADEFEVQRGLRVGGRQLPVVNDRIPFVRATLDGFVFESPAEDADPIALLETKTVSQRSGDWKDEKGDPQVPDYVEVQVQHQLVASGLDHAFVAALVMWPAPRLQVFEVARDAHSITTLLAIETAFWDRVQRKDPPPADSYQETSDALRAAFAESWRGRSIEMTDVALQLVDDRNRAWHEEQRAKDSKARAENGLMAFLGENEVGIRNGKIVVTWSRVESTRWDSAALHDHLERHPRSHLDRFLKTSPSRRFTFRSKSILDEAQGD